MLKNQVEVVSIKGPDGCGVGASAKPWAERSLDMGAQAKLCGWSEGKVRASPISQWTWHCNVILHIYIPESLSLVGRHLQSHQKWAPSITDHVLVQKVSRGMAVMFYYDSE